MDNPADDMIDELFDIEHHEAVAVTFSQEVDKYLQINNHPSRTDRLLWPVEGEPTQISASGHFGKDVFVIPCTSAPSERLFSHLNLVVSKTLMIEADVHAASSCHEVKNTPWYE